MAEPPTDQELVKAFLDATLHMSQSEVGRQVPGVTQKDMSRWKVGNWQRLSNDKREALRRFLSGPTREMEGTQESASSEGADLAYFWERESRIAETRAQALLTEARAILQEAEAATVRARAYERGEINAELRARGITGIVSVPGEAPERGVEPAYPPGVAGHLLRQFLEMLRQAREDYGEPDGPRT
jgi:hypothetical protein